MPDDARFEPLHRSDQRVIRTVDSLIGETWTGSSVLPGWSRAHVVAHLTLNAEGFARALDGLLEGEVVPIYDSDAARDTAIEDLAGAGADEIRDRFYAATQHLRSLFTALSAEHWDAGTVNRLPGGPVWPVSRLPVARRKEVEIHHADLGLNYTADDWPEDFVLPVLDDLAEHQASSTQTPAFRMTATDLGRTWGSDGPLVSGTAGALAWWLLGRGAGEGLVAQGGALPAISPWHQPPRPAS